MILGIVGSRTLNKPLPDEIMPRYIDRIISGSAKGIDTCARNYALEKHIMITEIIPEYELYGKRAPIIRNDIIINQSDILYIFWDGKSRGSYYVIKKCRELGKPYRVFTMENDEYVPMKQVP